MRQFLSQSFPDRKGMIFINGKDFRYMRQVLRTKVGDMISVRLPDGKLQNTTVTKISEDTKTIALQVCSCQTDNSSPLNTLSAPEKESNNVSAAQINSESRATEYWLFQFIAKPTKMELIIRQAVECGVSNIVPIKGAFSQNQNINSLSSSKEERIQRIIKEARQQSGSPIDTKVFPPMSLQEACDLWKEQCGKTKNNAAAVLWERSNDTKSLHKVFSGNKIDIAAVAAGSEGGISSDEIELMKEYGFIPVHFAVNILRCETAALYGIAAVQSAVLEKESWEFRK